MLVSTKSFPVARKNSPPETKFEGLVGKQMIWDACFGGDRAWTSLIPRPGFALGNSEVVGCPEGAGELGQKLVTA